METLNFTLSYSENRKSENAIPVVIVAAGSSTRMKGIAKPFAEIGGIPVIVRTLLAFERSNRISNIVLVTKKEFIPEMQKFADAYAISKLTDIVEGGSNRQESVLCGIKTVKNAEKVLIHDGARPLVSLDLIDKICDEIKDKPCVICATKVKDTIKSVASDGFVRTTHKRDELYSVQTPQAVDLNDYLKIFENTNTEIFTDDASMFESYNYPVKVVEGEYTNLKITTPEDIALAEFYIEQLGDNL